LPLARCPLVFWPCMAALAYTVKPFFFLVFPCVSLATAAVVARLASRPAAPATAPGFLGRVLGEIGVISYSIYLLHGPLLAFAAKALRAAFPAHGFSPVEMGGCLALFCAALFAVSWLFYRWVELPGIGLGKGVLKRMQPEPAPASRCNASKA
ncbi:MAG: hypothetical protein PHQ12_11325, partial [Chthoniobacteraceae bacterium]|nr:hypothetical protein [Chthoniobacteraceae bacterium]